MYIEKIAQNKDLSKKDLLDEIESRFGRYLTSFELETDGEESTRKLKLLMMYL